MGMPQIPKRNIEQVRHDLLESIALEEAALAHLINAEAEKVQALAKHLPKPRTFEEAAEMQKIILAFVQAAQLKELILIEKMRAVGNLWFPCDDSSGSSSGDCSGSGSGTGSGE